MPASTSSHAISLVSVFFFPFSKFSCLPFCISTILIFNVFCLFDSQRGSAALQLVPSTLYRNQTNSYCSDDDSTLRPLLQKLVLAIYEHSYELCDARVYGCRLRCVPCSIHIEFVSLCSFAIFGSIPFCSERNKNAEFFVLFFLFFYSFSLIGYVSTEL